MKNNYFKTIDHTMDNFFCYLVKLYETIGLLAMIGIMLMLVVQTILKWFSVSILWSDELVSLLNIWLIFMAATVVEHEKKYLRMAFITNKLPKVIQILLDIVLYILIIFSLCIVFKGGIAYIKQTHNIVTNIMRLPMICMYLAPLIAIGTMILMYCRELVLQFYALFVPLLIRGGVNTK